MKVVITGGLGFIALRLARRLIKDGHGVTLIDNLSSQIHGDLPNVDAPEGAHVVRIDICDIADRYELINGCDVIFHLAAETGTAQSMYQISHYTRVNCAGTTALLEAIAKCTNKPRHVVLASSRSVYGEGAYYNFDGSKREIISGPRRTREALEAACWEPLAEDGTALSAAPTPEDLPFSPGSIYAATKASQELLLTSSGESLGFRLSIFRFQNVYGEGQSLRNPYTGIISIFYNRARQGLEIPIYEDGLESRDFVHVDDVVDVLVTSIDTHLPNGIAINIGSGEQTSVRQLATSLLRASGFSVPITVTGQYRIGDIRHCFADLTKLKKYVGYSPKICLTDGLERFCAWASTQPIHEDLLIKAESELQTRGLLKR